MGFQTINVINRPTPVLIVLGNVAEAHTLANNDIVNSIWIGSNKSIKVGDPDAMEIPALGSAPLPTNSSTYAISSVAGPVQCLLMPGIGGWTAAPSKIQASLNALGLMKDTTGININNNVTGVSKDATLAAQTSGATIATDVSNSGVPLLTKSTVIFSNLSHVITHASPTWQAFLNSSLLKPSYEVFVTLGSMAADGQPWAQIQLFWKDSASGQQVAQQDYVVGVGTTTSCQYHGVGPIHADQLSIFINNLGLVSDLTAGLIVLNNSTPALSELWKTENIFAINGQSLPSAYLPANLLAMDNGSVANGGNRVKQLPLYTGEPVNARVNTSSNTTDLEFEIRVPSSMRAALGLPQTTPEFFDYNSDSHGLIQANAISLPRLMMELIVINHNAAAQTLVTNVAGV